jgi:hypothetical protein
MLLAEDWAHELAREIAERYCQRKEVAGETQTVLRMIEVRCPFRRGAEYVECEPAPPKKRLL